MITGSASTGWTVLTSSSATVTGFQAPGGLASNPIKYTPRIGDLVLLKQAVPGYDTRSGWSVEMNVYLGAIVRIIAVQSINEFRIDQSDHLSHTQWIFYTRDVERIATEDERLEWLKKEQLIKEEKEKKIKTLCLSGSKIERVAKDVFGDEFVMVEGDGPSINVIVYFPKIHMTNSHNERHSITDVFIKFKLSDIGAAPTGMHCRLGIFGARTTFTSKEVEVGYSHSHLSSGVRFPDQSWGTFCLGSEGSSFMVAVNTITLSAQEQDWYMLFLSLKNYLSWESIEGGPYIHIRTIGQASNRSASISPSVLEEEASRLLHLLPFEFWEYTPDGFTLNPNNPELVDFFDSESVLRTTRTVIHSNNYLSRLRTYEHTSYTFNGKRFPFVISDKPEEENKTEKHVEQGIIDSICNILKNRITSFSKTYNYELQKSRGQGIFAKAGILQSA